MSQDQECRVDGLLDLPREQAFSLFVDRPGLWWSSPFREHGRGDSGTGVEVGIEPFAGGACYEIDGEGRRRIWGTVLSIEAPLFIRLAWQVTQDGEQIADPGTASRVMVNFRQAGELTRLEIVHNEFLRHGEEGTEYAGRMRQTDGWPRILRQLQDAARRMA
ncbi:SRPBCC family protein [Roseibium aggregatum]|uniref:SRPBCC family protein n=1 Tax=Roseibium aggregatum TaxID=187304 RepID=A0A939J287_9HYPH|nr:SRPBCC family protein [Roseibium aggregatum]MBN9669282.1 SRPBCC family protein [Roseibium aggregatum]